MGHNVNTAASFPHMLRSFRQATAAELRLRRWELTGIEDREALTTYHRSVTGIGYHWRRSPATGAPPLRIAEAIQRAADDRDTSDW